MRRLWFKSSTLLSSLLSPLSSQQPWSAHAAAAAAAAVAATVEGEMSRSERRAHLSRILDSHLQSIRETMQVLENPAASTLDKVDWKEVTKLGDEVSKQATVAGMLWSGETPELKALEENLGSFCNTLNGFILLSHGSTVRAGATLHSSIHASVKQVLDSSISLLKEAVSSYESRNSNKKLLIPQLAGSVWEACDALKKAPTSNCIAIGRSMTHVAVSVKDVLREMGELKSASSFDFEHPASKEESVSEEEIDLNDELGADLSPEEMHIAQLAISVVTDTLAVVKELIRFITGLLKSSNKDASTEEYTDPLERLLSYCQEMGSQVSELGACVYPPQEISQMKFIAKILRRRIDEVRHEVKSLGDSADGLFDAIKVMENELGKLECELGDDITTQMGKMTM